MNAFEKKTVVIKCTVLIQIYREKYVNRVLFAVFHVDDDFSSFFKYIFFRAGNGIKAEEQGFLKNAGVPDQEAQVIIKSKHQQKIELKKNLNNINRPDFQLTFS